MHRPHRIGVGMLALGLFVSGCYGPFNLTRRLYRWNGQIEGKWEKEFVFLLLAVTNIYSLAGLGDAIAFNSMEFWTGKNPVDAPAMGRKGALPSTKHLARGAQEAFLTYVPSPEGSRLVVQQFRQGEPAGTLQVQRRQGITVASDANGHTLLTARTLSDGGIRIDDSEGKQVASYSADQVERVFQSTPQ